LDAATLVGSAKKFGTPQYILSEGDLKARAERIKAAFRRGYRNTEFFYPYKTNDLPYLCRLVHGAGFGAEVSSAIELELAKKVGARRVMFGGPGKSPALLRALAGTRGITIMADSLSELEDLRKLDIEFGIRLDMKNKKGFQWEKFGVHQSDVLANVDKLEASKLSGFGFHLGSELIKPGAYVDALKELSGFVKKLSPESRKKIRFIDIGGGFYGEGYSKVSLSEFVNMFSERRVPNFPTPTNGRIPPIEEFAERITAEFKRSVADVKGLGGVRLCVEPGRWLVNDCMHLLAKIVRKKGERSVVLDAGINLAPHIVYEHHPIYNLSRPGSSPRKCTLYGNLCMARDVIGRSYFGSGIEEGDIILVKNIGAYSVSESTQFMGPKAKVVSIGRTAKLVRKEEDFRYRYGRDI
jgi:diaminopimelate decarboxylase